MLLQSLVILFLSFWIYQEYLNNSYLQAYVSSYLGGYSLAVITLGSIGSFTAVAVVLYAKLRHTRRELEGMLSAERVGSGGGVRGQPLDSRVEQHLIEMIQKTQPIMNSRPGTGGEMPTLRRVDSESSEEQSSN